MRAVILGLLLLRAAKSLYAITELPEYTLHATLMRGEVLLHKAQSPYRLCVVGICYFVTKDLRLVLFDRIEGGPRPTDMHPVAFDPVKREFSPDRRFPRRDGGYGSSASLFRFDPLALVVHRRQDCLCIVRSQQHFVGHRCAQASSRGRSPLCRRRSLGPCESYHPFPSGYVLERVLRDECII